MKKKNCTTDYIIDAVLVFGEINYTADNLTAHFIKNTITDGGVAPQCSFARPTRNTENTDSQRTLRNKKI